VVNSLFNIPPRVFPMATKPWITNVFKPLDMFVNNNYPNKMPDKFDKWILKFSGNNVITVEEHIEFFYDVFGSCYIE
jgi:hypothetical protein